MLDRLARFSYHRRRAVLLVWIVVLVGTSIAGNAFGGEPSMSFRLPDGSAQKASDLLKSAGNGQSGARGSIVIAAPTGVKDPAVTARVDALLAEVAKLPHVSSVVSPYDAANPRAAFQVSKDGTVAYADIQFDVDGREVLKPTAERIATVVDKARADGVQFELSGFMFATQAPPGASELIGIVAAIIILLISFGSVLAMGLPIITALFGIGIGLAGVQLLSNVMSMPEFASQLAAMIGIGVGIDYALFIVTRYRNALHDGRTPEDSVALAIRTSGKAVLFAGCTVVISLMGMFLIGIDFLYGLATGAALAVLITMIASVTLLPAILGFTGHNIDKWGLPWAKSTKTSERNIWFRWSRVVQRRPWTMALIGLAILGTLAFPVFQMRLGSSDAGNLPKTDTTRRAYDLLSDGFGKGFNGPLFVAIKVPDAAGAAALPALADAARSTEGVAQVIGPIPLKAGSDVTQMIVFPTTSPQDQKTVDLINRLDTKVLPAATAGTGVRAFVGGATAAFEELGQTLSDRLPIFIGAVLAVSFLLLMMVFRSLMVPLKAVIMNLLSIGAAYGLLVLIFQNGVTFGLDVGSKGPIESFVPMMMFAILFGLSMDYEVFLLSRIKEEYDRHGDNATAVADGLSHTARVITAAAAIMVCVFGSFMFGDGRVIKEFGLGLAFAVFIDATVVRMILVPATMELLGDANWWLPRWLDRILPNISIEGDPADHLPPEPPAEAERELVEVG